MEMVLALTHEMKVENLPQTKRLTFTSFATDGGDGKTDFAGAMMDGCEIEAMSLKEMKQKLREHDSLNFFLKNKSELINKMNTNTNVMDILIILYSA